MIFGVQEAEQVPTKIVLAQDTEPLVDVVWVEFVVFEAEEEDAVALANLKVCQSFPKFPWNVLDVL